MKHTDHRYLLDGEEFRIVIIGDVISIPGYAGKAGWSMGGFGPNITSEWLLREGGLPGSAARKRALADMIVRSVQTTTKGGEAEGDGRERPRGPFARCPRCHASAIPGFVPVTEGDGLEPVLATG